MIDFGMIQGEWIPSYALPGVEDLDLVNTTLSQPLQPV